MPAYEDVGRCSAKYFKSAQAATEVAGRDGDAAAPDSPLLRGEASPHVALLVEAEDLDGG